MATEQDIFDFAVSQNPNLKNKNFRDVVDFAYSQNPNLRNAITQPTPQAPTAISSFAAGKMGGIPETNVAPLQLAEKAVKAPGGLATIGAIAAGPFTGGMTWPYAAATMATVGAAGALGRQKIMGEDIDLSEMAKEGALAASGEAGVRAGLTLTAKAANALRGPLRRAIATMLSLGRGPKSSYESIARAMGGEGVEQTFKEAAPELVQARQANEMTRLEPIISKKLTSAFDDVQNTMEANRAKWGKAVERADNALINRTKDIKIDMTKTALKSIDEIGKIEQDATIKALIGNNPELKQISDAVLEMGSKPKTVEELINLRRQLDEVITWKRMPVGPKIPDAVEAVYKQLRADVANKIVDISNKKGVKMYQPIYNKFSEMATDWDDTLRKVYSSASDSDLAQKNAADKFVAYFNKGGYNAEILGNTSKHLGKDGKKKVEKLLDIAAARNILEDSGAPSDTMVGIFRKLMVNPTIISAVKKGTDIGPIVKSEIAKSLGGGLGAATNIQIQK